MFDFCHLYYDSEQTSFEEVDFTVSNKDDTSMPSLTVRSVLLGLMYVLGMSFLHQWTYTAQYRFYIGPYLVIVTAHLLGRLPMLFKKSRFSLKEETIVLLMSNVAWNFTSQYQYSTASFIFQIDREKFEYVHIVFIALAVQVAGYGFAGILRRYLVWPSGQTWPANMPYIALLRTLNENQRIIEDKVYGLNRRSKWWKLFDNQKYFFCIISTIQFIYCWIPQYVMRVLSSFSWICMIATNNLTLSQITGYRALGFGSLTFDWLSICRYLGSPFVVPKWAMINIGIGFLVTTWIVTPIIYVTNVWNCKEQSIGYFPAPRILTHESPKWSALGLASTAASFSVPVAAIIHMFLFQGKELLKLSLTRTIRFKGNDVHCRLISAYKDVPDWWYGIVTILAVILLIIICEVSGCLQWYYVLLALVVPLIFSLPMGSIFSITGQIIQSASIFSMCLVIGFALFGDEEIASNRTLFTTISYTAFTQSLYLTSDMKLAHYMKIAPRILFFVQTLSCVVCTIFSTVFQQYYIESESRNGTLPAARYVTQSQFNEVSAFVNKSFFSMNSRYQIFLWILIIGGSLPIIFWLGSYRWSWCKYVNIPLVLMLMSWMPALPAGTLFTWIVTGLLTVFIFNKECWKRHIFLFSAALSFALNFMLIIAGAILWNRDIYFPHWWGTGGRNNDGCPLALNKTVGDWFFLSLFDRDN